MDYLNSNKHLFIIFLAFYLQQIKQVEYIFVMNALGLRNSFEDKSTIILYDDFIESFVSLFEL